LSAQILLTPANKYKTIFYLVDVFEKLWTTRFTQPQLDFLIVQQFVGQLETAFDKTKTTSECKKGLSLKTPLNATMHILAAVARRSVSAFNYFSSFASPSCRSNSR